MGAIECLLQDNEEKLVNGYSADDVEQKEHCKTMKPDFTLVIHGGAGEEMMLNEKVIGTIEFALQTALTLGAQVLVREVVVGCSTKKCRCIGGLFLV